MEEYKMAETKRKKSKNLEVVNIPLAELHPFPDQPFAVRDDESMQETAASIKEYGVLTPAVARPLASGGYGRNLRQRAGYGNR